MSQPYFDKSWTDTIEEARKIAVGRGQEYGDSWGDNADYSEMRNTLKLIFGLEATNEQCRIVMLSALVNAKQNRKQGGHKEDTDIDLINYLAAKTYAIKQYLQNTRNHEHCRSVHNV